MTTTIIFSSVSAVMASKILKQKGYPNASKLVFPFYAVACTIGLVFVVRGIFLG